MTAEKLSPLLEKTRRDWQLPGLSACIFDLNGLNTLATGHRDLESGEALTESTVFPIASVTKTFTGEAIANAVQAGQFNWNDRLKKLLPGFRLHDPKATNQMTVGDAATHRSGLPPHTWSWVFGDCSRKQFMLERLPHLKSHQPYDEGHTYSNILYGLLGYLLEERTGLSWEEDLRTHFLKPLGMTRTGFLDGKWSTSLGDLALPYGADGKRIPYFAATDQHPIAPASEMYASMRDLALWGRHLLAHTIDRDPWKPRSRIRTQRPFRDLGPLDYGYGWRIETFQNSKHVWHSGHCSGYTTLLSIQPEEGKGIALACNRSNAIKALYRIAYAYHDRMGRNWDELFPVQKPTQRPEKDRSEPPEESPGSITPGLYHNQGYGDFAILRRGDQWYGKFQNSNPAPLRWRSDNSAYWVIPIYEVGFDLSWNQAGTAFDVPFEPRTNPVRFTLAQ